MDWTWAAVIGVPGACVALSSLALTIPWSDRRLHIKRVEELSKVVNAAGDDCPKLLRIKLIQELYWVEACYVIAPRFANTAGLLGTALLMPTVLTLAIQLYGREMFAGMGKPGYVLGVLAVVVVWFGSLEFMLRTGHSVVLIQAHRRLYAKTGSKVDMAWPLPRKVQLLMESRLILRQRDVDRMLTEAFGDMDPDPRRLAGPQLAKLRRNLEATRGPLLNRTTPQ